MKIRTGFVSNSSSSSFCLIGTDNKIALRQALKKEFKITEKDFEDESNIWEKCEFGHGYTSGDTFEFHGNETPEMVGINAEELLQTMTIPEAIKHVAVIFKKNKIEVPENEIKFMFGEAGN